MPGVVYKLHFVKILKMPTVVLMYSKENNYYFLYPLNDYSLTVDLVKHAELFSNYRPLHLSILLNELLFISNWFFYAIIFNQQKNSPSHIQNMLM